MEMQDLLRWMLEQGGSDLHLKVGSPPAIRLRGRLLKSEGAPIKEVDLHHWIGDLATPDLMERLEKEREGDFAYHLPNGPRFRCNVFHQMGHLGSVLRVIPQVIPTLDELGMPPILKSLTEREYGIVLVTGPTGSGKSTTLAALIEHINENNEKHILTIEDPVEFVHADRRSLINQREIGSDTPSFAEAMRRSLRQDPDVILVGEMRDPETIAIAMTAAETGHLVLSTLHTNDAKQSVDRIVDSFPPSEQHLMRTKLANTLVGVVSQRLVQRADGSGRVVVQEIMLNSPTIRHLIEEDKIAGIDKAIEESADYYGMQSMNQHLIQYWEQGVIREEDALAISNNPGDLRLKMQTERYSAQAASTKANNPAPKKSSLESRYG